MSGLSFLPRKFFEVDWWREVVDSWNKSGRCGRLSGLGPIAFELVQADSTVVCVDWDDLGVGRLVSCHAPKALIKGELSGWQSFMSGDRGAIDCVLGGELSCSGDVKHVLAFAPAFEELAKVARGTREFDQ